MRPATFVAIEGLDGSGKRTLCENIRRLAEEAELTVGLVSFPRYGETHASDSISAYLNGKLGTPESLSPYFTALLYAQDRYESRGNLLSKLETFDIVLADRYVASNLAYQAARVVPELRPELLTWIEDLELTRLGLPTPDLNILVRTTPVASRTLVSQKNERQYTTNTYDVLEDNARLLGEVATCYELLTDTDLCGPWVSVDLLSQGGFRPPQDVAASAWEYIMAERARRS